MLQIQQGPAAHNCQGISRRTALKAGFLGIAGLTLPDLLRLRAEGSAEKKDTAVILLWLDGGPSPAGNLRSQARCTRRLSRAVQGDQDQGTRHPG